VFLPTSKKIYQVKKEHISQQFGIIRLLNLDLTYIKNMRDKNKIMFVFPPLENFHREPIYILYFLFPPYHWSPPMGETLMQVKSTCTYIYTSEAVFPSWQKLSKSFAKLLEECFYFFPIIIDANLIWQTIGDTLSEIYIFK
jgi:hypothetical protein